ncbi:MAG: nucleotidyltransferase domain-containing protein [Candidatus Aegiribacteria sp.]|nr:nucleotidyltransferase domain-containing protein [Candidatus Aegiribacteria sp.]
MGTKNNDAAHALFGKVRRCLLSLLFLNPDRTYYFREIRDIIGSGSGAVHRELANLVDAGLVTLNKQANQHRYRVNRESPVFQELYDFFKKTTGLPHQIGKVLEKLESEIRLAFIFGSYASGEFRSESDVDLMVIGDVEFQDIISAIHGIQEKTGREINPVVYSAGSFRDRLDSGFIKDIMKSPKLYLIGGEDEFKKIVR